MTLPTDWGRRLIDTGAELMERLGPAVDAADPEGTIRPASRLLCAGLAELAGCFWRGRTGGEPPPAVLEAAALLALLTKLDDQVIDSLEFHGGSGTDRALLRSRTSAWLAPTLESIRAARAVEDSPRCRLAARLGELLELLCPEHQRRGLLLDVIADGWAIQTAAVAVLTAHPSQVTQVEIDRVTADISGAWLLMVALVGALPPAFGAWPDGDVQAAFFDWGLHIQRADALSDLDSDQAEGLISTAPAWLAWHADPAACEAAAAGRDPGGLHELLVGHDLDLRCLPDPAALESLDGRLAGLGDVSGLLRWIHGFLLGRYLVGPRSRRSADHPAFAPFLSDWSSWQTAPRRSHCSGP